MIHQIPSWNPGEPVSAGKLARMSDMINDLDRQINGALQRPGNGMTFNRSTGGVSCTPMMQARWINGAAVSLPFAIETGKDKDGNSIVIVYCNGGVFANDEHKVIGLDWDEDEKMVSSYDETQKTVVMLSWTYSYDGTIHYANLLTETYNEIEDIDLVPAPIGGPDEIGISRVILGAVIPEEDGVKITQLVMTSLVTRWHARWKNPDDPDNLYVAQYADASIGYL